MPLKRILASDIHQRLTGYKLIFVSASVFHFFACDPFLEYQGHGTAAIHKSWLTKEIV